MKHQEYYRKVNNCTAEHPTDSRCMCWHKVTDETDINGLTLRDERVYI